jgi:molybdopterin molybdotransferase
MIERLLGQTVTETPVETARLAVPIEANGPRQHYMRARLSPNPDGQPTVAPLPSQDSSLVAIFAAADCLIIRPSHAPAATMGEQVEIMRLDF